MSVTRDCPNCFRKIKTSSKFCKFCGTTLKICLECQTINKANDAFCAECGFDIKDVEVAEGFSEVTDSVETSSEEDFTLTEDGVEEDQIKQERKLVMWPPISQSRYLSQARPQPKVKPYMKYLEEGPSYEPKKLSYTYNRVRLLGFLSGPLPTSNVLSSVVEAFGIALALIAGGIVIFSIGMAFFQYIIFPIIAGIIGGALLLSAPFFGIYYVSSNWLYRAFKIMRPVKLKTIVWNYTLASLIFSLIGLMFAPILLEGGALGITLAVVGGIVYTMGLIVVPLKAYLADLVYVKAAVDLRDSEPKEEKVVTKENKKNGEK